MNAYTEAAGPDQTAFPKVLFERLNDFFVHNYLSKKANGQMVFKIFFGLSWWAVTYACLYLFHLSFLQVLLIYLLHGLSHIFIVFNIAHDANHQAISHKRGINRLLSYTFDLCGVNSYMWRILHHKGHHFCPNIHGDDESIIAHGLIRLSPHADNKKMFRYQHIYAFFMYSLVSLDYVFFKDFEYFFFSSYKLAKKTKHRKSEYIILVAGKLIYYFYILALPVMLAGIPVWQVLTAFLLMHLMIGLSVTLVFQSAHVLETAVFPASKDDFRHYVFHIMATTADYSTANPAVQWLTGGLNLHVIHHFYPQVCHTHFPKLTSILRETSREFGIEYRENKTMYKALVQHYHLLKQLGCQDAELSK